MTKILANSPLLNRTSVAILGGVKPNKWETRLGWLSPFKDTRVVCVSMKSFGELSVQLDCEDLSARIEVYGAKVLSEEKGLWKYVPWTFKSTSNLVVPSCGDCLFQKACLKNVMFKFGFHLNSYSTLFILIKSIHNTTKYDFKSSVAVETRIANHVTVMEGLVIMARFF